MPVTDYEQTGSMHLGFGGHGSLTIAHYAPRTTDVEKLRASLHRRFGSDFGSTDDELGRYLERARERIGGLRLSRFIVAGDTLAAHKGIEGVREWFPSRP